MRLGLLDFYFFVIWLLDLDRGQYVCGEGGDLPVFMCLLFG